MTSQPIKRRLKLEVLHGKILRYSQVFLGSGQHGFPSRISRLGVAFAAGFVFMVSGWAFLGFTGPVRIASFVFVGWGSLLLLCSRSQRLTVGKANFLAYSGHLSALLIFYFLTTRFLNVVYSTDSIIGTYMGVVKVLQLENPYAFSIKPFLDQFGLPPSFYTPRVDGSFEFHLNYPASNFLFFLPGYLSGLHDLRDSVLIFHLLSLSLIFAIMPSKYKALSLAPFTFYFPWVVAGSVTDSVWAFCLLITAVLWYKKRGTSFVFLGLAVASKQLAMLALPYLLIRNWRETDATQRKTRMMRTIATLLLGFWIPNLPFFLSSPSSWWAGVVAPYMPGTTPQVMGGVGFSEVATALGLTPPSSTFFLLMGLTFAVTMYGYNRWFGRLKNLVWLMPVFILLFYYRSFPNYLFFWMVPLVADLSRVNMDMLRRVQPSLPSMPTVQVKFRLPGFPQGSMAPTLLLGLVLTAAFAGVSGAYVSRNSEYRVSVHVHSIMDPDSLGVVTLMRVSVMNIGTEPVQPRFFVKFDVQPYLWDNLNVTNPIVGLNTNSSFWIHPSDPIAAIPNHSDFRVWVYDSATGNLAGQSQSVPALLPKPEFVNPLFRWWTLDMSTGLKVPFGWHLSVSNLDPLYSGILPSDDGSTVTMRLNYTSTTQGLQRLGLYQTVSGNLTIADLVVARGLLLDESNKTEGAVFGASVTDGSHVLDFVFSNTATAQAVHVYPENTTIVLPVQLSNWSTLRVDLASLWDSQTWTPPRTFTLAFSLTATRPGVYYSSIREISQAPVPPVQ